MHNLCVAEGVLEIKNMHACSFACHSIGNLSTRRKRYFSMVLFSFYF